MYPFEDDLKKELITFNELKKKVRTLEKELLESKGKIQTWMEINNLICFDIDGYTLKFEPRKLKLDQNPEHEYESSIFRVFSK